MIWKIDINILKRLIVTKDIFHTFLEICEIIGFDDQIIKQIICKFPDNYDIDKLSDQLVNQLSKRQYYMTITKKRELFTI